MGLLVLSPRLPRRHEVVTHYPGHLDRLRDINRAWY